MSRLPQHRFPGSQPQQIFREFAVAGPAVEIAERLTAGRLPRETLTGRLYYAHPPVGSL